MFQIKHNCVSGCISLYLLLSLIFTRLIPIQVNLQSKTIDKWLKWMGSIWYPMIELETYRDSKSFGDVSWHTICSMEVFTALSNLIKMAYRPMLIVTQKLTTMAFGLYDGLIDVVSFSLPLLVPIDFICSCNSVFVFFLLSLKISDVKLTHTLIYIYIYILTYLYNY